MGVSVVIEPNVEKLADRLGVEGLARFAAGDDAPRRLECDAVVPVVRQCSGGRLVAEPMRFKPYLIDRRHLAGDMFADALLGATHGLVALRLFSEWLSPMRLVQLGVVPPHEVHCAYNRFQPGGDGRERLVLGNFAPEDDALLLVPVLYAPTPEGPSNADFVLVCDAAPPEVAALGGRLAPIALDRETALQWLATGPDDATDTVDFAALLAGHRPASALSVALYKSA
jgi:hypothetical protein